MDEKVRKEVTDKLRIPRLRVEKAVILTQIHKETEGESMIIRRAKALHELLNKMPITIADWQLIVGSPSAEPFSVSPHPEGCWKWVLTELDSFSTREGDKYYVTEEDKKILRDILPWWKGKCLEDVILGMLPPEVYDAYKTGLIDSGAMVQGCGSCSPDYKKALETGFLEIIDQIKKKMTAMDLTDDKSYKKWLYYKAASICCDAVIDWAHRHAESAKNLAGKEIRSERKKELLLIADNCNKVPAHPSESLFEALQAFWLIHTAVHFESAGGMGIVPGRLDRWLYPYYKKDIERIGKEEIKRWLENLWINYNQMLLFLPSRVSLLWSGNPISEQPTLGGVDETGEDASNELTELILEVEKEVRLPQPDIGLMYHEKINDKVLYKCCETLPLTMKPKFFNHKIAVKHVLAKGATVRDVQRDLVSIGCVNSGIAGKTWGNHNQAFINLGKCIELTLGNGMGSPTEKKFESFSELMNAFKDQLKRAVRMAVIMSNIIETAHADLNPQPLAGVLIADSLEKGVPLWEGGARYNMPGFEAVGLGTVADSLAALKKLVFEDRVVSMAELLEAIHSNFEGDWEVLRRRLIHEAPKFGNDDDYVDTIAREVVAFYSAEVKKYKCPRSVPYYPGLYSVSAHMSLGRFVAGTPNGRKAKEPLSDGMSPSQGVCNKGPTAVVNSLSKIDHSRLPSGTLVNMKFAASMLKSSEKMMKFIEILKTYMDVGGYHVQFNIRDAATLRDAQLRPEKYSALLVRVAAYVAIFQELPKDLQDDIIARTELTLA